MQHDSNNTSSISILDECEAIKLELDSLERNFQQASKHPESILNNTIPTLRLLEARKDEIKSSTEFNRSNHAPQIGRIERKLKETEREYKIVESALRKRSEADATRQHRIANPSATDPEISNAIRDRGVPIFSPNLLISGRYETAISSHHHTHQRHLAFHGIESQIVELGEIFQDLDTAVQRQEPSVVCVEHNAETTHDHVQEANIEIDQANKKARSRKRTKWWCLLISLLIVAVTGVIIALVTKQ